MKICLTIISMLLLVTACGESDTGTQPARAATATAEEPTSSAAVAAEPTPTQTPAEGSAMASAESEAAENARQAFIAFVRDELPQTSGMEDDKRFAANLVADPPQPGAVRAVNGAEVVQILERMYGPQNVHANLLYGSPRNLVADMPCWIVRYETLMMGGVGGCVCGDPQEVALVWLLHEG